MDKFEGNTRTFFDKYYLRKIKTSSNQDTSDLDKFNCQYHQTFNVKQYLDEQIIINKDNLKILDLGCGSGEILLHLISNKKNCNFYAVDFSSKAIENLKNKVDLFVEKNKNLSIKINCLVGNAKSLPYKNNYFDYVYIIMLLHHVDDYLSVVKEACRVLKTNGKLIIVDLRGDDLFISTISKIIRFLPKNFLNKLFGDDLLIKKTFPKRSKVSTKKLRQFLINSDVSIVDEDYYYYIFQYLYYFYKLFPFTFKYLLFLNKLIIRFERKMSSLLKYHYDMYIYNCVKNR